MGILRRLLIGKKDPNAKITFLGVFNFGLLIPQLFILFQNPNAKVTNHYSINSEIGYKGFLDRLNSTNKKYVVLRFFENLPNGNRIGGDLDVLVEDSLQEYASEFLTQNPGTEMVDMYSVSGPSNAARIPYHTPFLSRQILDNAKTFRGYKVPNDKDYLNSFIYHCLYHKGLSSGIPSCYENLTISSSPDNDYLKKIKELGSNIGVDLGDTLEELDNYMESVGWKPHADTLDLLASSNKWIEQHLKSLKLAEEITLTVCVLKSGFHKHHSIDDFKNSLASVGFEVIHHEHLVGNRATLAYDHLRGGNWSASGSKEFSPSDIFIIFDKTKDGLLVRKFAIDYDPRSKKEALRKTYDVGYQSHIHMTDNTHQASEYINTMYPDKISFYKKSIIDFDSQYSGEVSLPLFNILKYKLKNLPPRIKESIMNFFKSKI